MPTYEYECSACGHQFEQFQSIKAAPLRKCPECKKNTAKRLISAGAGFIFKGSGFYITDYRSDSYKAAAKADAEKGSNGEKKSDTNAETKTESQPQTQAAKPVEPVKPAKATKSGGNGSSKRGS